MSKKENKDASFEDQFDVEGQETDDSFDKEDDAVSSNFSTSRSGGKDTQAVKKKNCELTRPKKRVGQPRMNLMTLGKSLNTWKKTTEKENQLFFEVDGLRCSK